MIKNNHIGLKEQPECGWQHVLSLMILTKTLKPEAENHANNPYG